MKILCVEPHYDDALLSAGGYLLEKAKQGDEISIVSVFADEGNDAEETKALCTMYNWGWFNLCHKNFPLKDFNLKYRLWHPIMYNKYIAPRAGEIADIQMKIKEIAKGFDQVLLPMGVGHPAHYVVSLFKVDKPVLYYRDFPHSYKKRAESHFKFLTAGFAKRLELVAKHSNLLDEKVALFKQIYKSQSGLLWFDKKYFEKKVEEEFYNETNKV